MPDSPFLGMRGTGSWANGIRPENWREMILRLYPNGSSPITAIMSMQASEPITDPVFHWFEKGLPSQRATVGGVFADPQLTVGVLGATSVGQILYLQTSLAGAKEFKIGHQVKISYPEGGIGYDRQGEVVNTLLSDDAHSYVSVKLHEATSNTYSVDDLSMVAVSGSGYEEGADMPDAITYDPEELYNNAQIYRTSLSLTKTALKTRIRYGSDAYKLAKMEALEIHAIEMEKSAIDGVRYTTTGAKGQPKRFTGGLIWAVKNRAPENIKDFRIDPEYAGKTWVQAGEDWLDANLTLVNTYGSGEKLGISGYGASRGIQSLVRAGSEFQISPSDKAYGIKVTDWVTSNGVLSMKTHPLFVEDPQYRNSILIYEPARFKFRPLRDTRFIEDPPEKNENRNNGKDSVDEEYLTEGGFEYNNAKTAMLMLGVGQDNVL